MNIVYISQYFPPEACAPAVRVDDFSRQWASDGHQVTVVTGFPNHPEGVIHEEYRRYWRRGLHRERREGVSVYRTWLYPGANRGYAGRAASYASFALSAAAVAPWVAPRGAVVIATSPQLLVGAAGYLAARLRRLPFVFEVRDLWPESLVGVGATNAGSGLYRVLDRLAKFLYRHADRIVVVGRRQQDALTDAGVDPGKISVVMNGVDDSFGAAGGDRQRTRLELGLDGRFVVTYCGTIGMAHGLETLLGAAARLRDRTDICFLVIGEGAERERLLERIRTLRLHNVRYLGKQPHHKVPACLAASDACLVLLRSCDVFKTAIPTKMFEAMAAAKPVILGVEGEARDILLSAQAGIAVPPENEDQVAQAIVTLSQNRVIAEALGENGQRAVRHDFSRKRQAARYLNVLAETVERYAQGRGGKAASTRASARYSTANKP